MGNATFDVEVRRHLTRLAAALGGRWAVAEVEGAGLRAIATAPTLAGELAGPGWTQALRRAEDTGIVVRVGSESAIHPSVGGGDRPLGSGPRLLIGEGLPDGPPAGPAAALVSVVAELLHALSLAARRSEEDRRVAERMELRAATDPLTGLLNRRGWDRLMALEEDRCRRHGRSADIVVVDLDGLKRVNDSRGHEAGDALLIRAATYIFSAVRVHDAVARLGGDEFGVLAVETEGTADSVAARVRTTLEEAEIAASVGSCSRSEATDLADAWRIADLRMYRAKQAMRRSRKAATRSPGSGGANPPAAPQRSARLPGPG